MEMTLNVYRQWNFIIKFKNNFDSQKKKKF